jgi:hypothetical protein
MHANYGDVLVSLPRRFRGHITIRTSHERIAFSPALNECTALLSDAPSSRVYFVGDRPRGGAGGTGRGDETPLAEDEPVDELYERADQLGWRSGTARDVARWLDVVFQRCRQIFLDRPNVVTTS